MKIIGMVMLSVGLLFGGMGAGFFLGFTMPENRDYRIATNENITPIVAEVVRYERTNTHVNNVQMYRIHFEWADGEGRSRATFNREEARGMVGEEIYIRIDGDRAVMVDFERSVLSLLGWIFLGVFGGLGFGGLVSGVILLVLPNRAGNREVNV